jgi:hypothetical protein
MHIHQLGCSTDLVVGPLITAPLVIWTGEPWSCCMIVVAESKCEHPSLAKLAAPHSASIFSRPRRPGALLGRHRSLRKLHVTPRLVASSTCSPLTWSASTRLSSHGPTTLDEFDSKERAAGPASLRCHCPSAHKTFRATLRLPRALALWTSPETERAPFNEEHCEAGSAIRLPLLRDEPRHRLPACR